MSRQDAFERIVEALNETMLDDSLWPGTSALIDEAFGAMGNVLTVGAGRSGGNVEIHFAKCYYRGVDRSAWQRDYFENYHRDDEHLPRMRMLPDAKIVPVARLFSDEEKKVSRMYNEALPLRHGQRGLTVRLDGPGGSRIVWGIADPVDTNGWSSSRIDTIARVVPQPGRLALPDDAVEAHVTPPGVDRRLRAGAVENLRKWYEEDYRFLELCREILRRNRWIRAKRRRLREHLLGWG